MPKKNKVDKVDNVVEKADELSVEVIESGDACEDIANGSIECNEEASVEVAEVIVPSAQDAMLVKLRKHRDDVAKQAQAKIDNRPSNKPVPVVAGKPRNICGINDARYLLNAPSDKNGNFAKLKECVGGIKSILNLNPARIDEVVAQMEFYTQYFKDYAEFNKEYAVNRAKEAVINSERIALAESLATKAANERKLEEAKLLVASLEAVV